MVDLKALVPWRSQSETPATRDDVFAPLATFRREVDRLFESFFDGFGGRSLVSTAVGALAGLILGLWFGPLPLAVIAGFVGTVAAAIIRNTLLAYAWGAAGVDDAGTPIMVTTFAAVASLAGSLAADRIALLIGAMPAVVIGGFAGLLSAVLFGLLMVAYRMNPDRPENLAL